uniref:Kinesin motor domain-containing protein n=1 Tax=Oncorhynchus mykiss TaxID=8022 RepID=A0A8C7TWD9_ONCMY
MASVRVAVRVRPLIKREKEVSAKVIIHMEGSTTSIDCNKKHLSKGTPGTGLKDRGRQSFSYDFSYDSTDVGSPNFVPQEKVFKDLGCDVLEAAFDGYNACVFAYGQTGSGKSHTMMGSPGDFGLIPRICEGLFCQISEKSQGDVASFRTEVSYLEIYNEHVQDLLTTKKSPENGSGLKVREHPKDGPYVEDLSKHLVQNYKDIEKLLHAGKAKRTTSSTGMNDVSSRSHAIFTINFTQARFDAELPCEMVSKIHLVDLAGSERADATCATGARLKEGANINKSLVTLGIVISALGDRGGSHKGKRKKQLFIPYRDSVLTWLLKDSLGGNSKTIMIATLSPADVNYSETLSTLHYANRAKNIFNKPTVNEDSSVTVIRKLQEEIVRLKRLVEKNNQALLSPQDLSKTLKVEEKLHKNEVKVLELTREWTNKWGETQNILKEETVALRKQGIGVVMDSKLPHLIGIDDDLLSTGTILYHLKEGRTLVGRDEASSNPDIVVHGAGLLEEHCVFENRDGVVTLIPQTGALCSVNRLETTQPCQLTQGAVIQLGRGTIFRFNHPKEAAHLREQRKSGLLSSLSLTDFSRLFQPGNRMDVFAEAGEKGDSRQQRSSVLSPQLQSCTVMTKAMPMEAPVSVSRHPSACYAVPLQIGAGALQHLQAVSSLQAGVNGWSFGAAEDHGRPCSSTNVESQRRARASPVHRTGTPTLTSNPTLTPTALEWDSLQQGLEGEVVEEWDLCHQSAYGVGVSYRWLEGTLPLRRAREEGGLYWGEEAWSEPGDRDEERNRALQQTPVLLVQQADVCTVGPEGLPGPANKSPGVLSGLPDGCIVLGGVLATDCCRGDLSRAGARYGGPAGTSLGTAVSYLQRGDGGGIDGWTEERTDRAHLPQASSSSTYTQTSPSRFDTHTPSLSQIDTHNCSQATHTATRQDRHRRSQAVRGLPLEALEGQFSRVMMDRSRMTVEGHRENDKEGEAGARREEVEQSFRLGAPVSRVFREEEERKEEPEEENQFSVSGLSALVRRVCQISGIGGEQELDSLGEEVSGMVSLVSRGLSWMFPDTGRLLRSSTPRILQQVWEGTGVLQPAAGGGAGSLQPGGGGGASSNWSSQVVRESQVLSVVKDSQVFSLVRESQMYSLVRDSQVFSMVSELPFVHHISTELTQDFRIIHNKLTQVLQPVESTGLQQKYIYLNKIPEMKLPLVHNTVLSTVPSLYPAHNTIEFANKQSTGKEVDWRTEDHSPISELACTLEQEGREEALAKSEEPSPIREMECTLEQEGGKEALRKLEEQSPVRELQCTSEHQGREKSLAKSEEKSPIRELECTSELEGKEEALAKSEEKSPIRELPCTSEHEGGEEALAKSEDPSPIRELESTSEMEGREEAQSEEQNPIRELPCTSEHEGGEEALAKSEEPSPIRELEYTLEQEGGKEVLAMSEEWSPIRELQCSLEQEGREEALAKSEEPSPSRELACTLEQEVIEEALAKSEEQSPIRELQWTSEHEGREEALPKLEELKCTSELEAGEKALAQSEEQSPVRELECASEHEGKEEAQALSEEQSPIRELQCTSEHEGGDEAKAKSEEPSPIRELQCTSEQEGREEALARAEEQSPVREVECTSEHEGKEEAQALSEEQCPIREVECTSEHEGGDEALPKLEEQSPIREVEYTSAQEGREEALAKSEEPSPIREVESTSELEGREEPLAQSEEQSPVRELQCTSEHEGGDEALAKSEDPSPIRELQCTSVQKGREEALAQSKEQSPSRELACTLEQEVIEEALAKSEEQSPVRELQCTSEYEGVEEALAKSEDPSSTRELECTSENEGGEEALSKSEEQSITKKALWPSKDQIEIVEDQHCVTCGAKSTKSQPPPEQRNNTSSTGPENIFIPGHGNQRTDDVQVYYGSLVEFPGALVKLQSLPVSTLLGCLQSVLPSVFTSQRLLGLYWLGVANCSQPHPHLALVLLLESCLYALTFDPDTTDQTTPLTVFHHLPLLQVKEILVGFGGQSLRLKASSEECVLTLYTHSQTLTQALTHTMLGVLCPGDQRVSQHPLLVENLMVLSLDWKAQAPDLLLNAELRLSGQFHRTLADLVYLVHGNMNREKPLLGEVRLLLYTSVGVTTTPDPRPDPWAQLLLTDTHLGLVQEDTVFHPAPHHVPLLSRQAQFKGVTLRCLSDVQCVIVRDGVGSSTSVCGDGAGDEGGATRLDIILSQDWRTRRERPRGHPERGAVAEADGSAVGGVAGASVLSAASNSCPPQQQAEVWKLHFSCSSEAACLINHLSNV